MAKQMLVQHTPLLIYIFPLVCKMMIELKGWQTSDVPAVKNTADNLIEKSSASIVVSSDQSHIDFDDIDDMGDFDAYATQNNQPISSKSDLDRYLKDSLVKRTLDFNILQ